MEWEVRLIEWMQANLGGLRDLVKLLAFLGSEIGLLMLVLIVMFCWKKQTGQKLVLIVSSLNVWLPMIKSLVLRPRPYMEYPDRVIPQALTEKGRAASDVAAQGYSFPSMHSASIPALYFSLAKDAKRQWLWILAAVLTVLGAFIIYFAVNTLLKLPFDKEFLNGASLGALLIRTGRYAVILFLITGVYPVVFPRFERIFSSD